MISYKISLPYENILEYTFEDDLKRRLKNPAFERLEESEVEYVLAKQLIEKRLKHISGTCQRADTTQAVISRIETMNANPSLNTLQRIASVLNAKLRITFQ